VTLTLTLILCPLRLNFNSVASKNATAVVQSRRPVRVSAVAAMPGKHKRKKKGAEGEHVLPPPCCTALCGVSA
jgi:hypothetical protein